MSAKDLFNKSINENDGLPSNDLPPSQRVRTGLPGRGPGPRRGPVDRMVGRDMDGPPGQFSPEETSMLKDVLIQMLAKLAGSPTDAEIGTAMATGTPLEPGQLQHILDEARNAPLTPEQGELMQKIYTQMQSA